MFSGCRSAVVLCFMLALWNTMATARELRICADPNNLPFSNERREGFENRIVELIAGDLGANVHYTWWAQRRGFIRNTVGAQLCDLIPGTIAGVSMLRTTAPYYRSSYVFVSRPGTPEITSFEDPTLRTAKIGVHLIGDDGFNVPPAHALASRGIVGNVRGYSLYGDYREVSPPSHLIEAISSGEIDVGIAWGPLGGYFGALQTPPLRITPVQPAIDGGVPMTYAIAMGVRRGNEALQRELDAILVHKRPDIDAILAQFHVPRIDPPHDARESGQ
jgi:mxaJ protein